MDFSAFFAAEPAQQGAPRRERRENPIAFLNLAPLVFPLWPFLGHAGGRAPRKGALGMAFRDFLRPKGLPYFSVSGRTSLPNHFYDPFLLLAGFSPSRPQCPAFGRLDFWRRKRSFFAPCLVVLVCSAVECRAIVVLLAPLARVARKPGRLDQIFVVPIRPLLGALSDSLLRGGQGLPLLSFCREPPCACPFCFARNLAPNLFLAASRLWR